MLNSEIQERKDKEDALIEECNKIKNAIKDKVITFKVKTGNNDKVFGNITSKQISEEISKLGYNIDKKKINTLGDINTLGVHEVEITLHNQVVFKMNVNLVK